MDLETIMSNLDIMRDSQLEESKAYYKNLPPEQNPVVGSEPVDIYKKKSKARRDNDKKNFPKGSSMLVMATVKQIVNGGGDLRAGLAHSHKKAADDSDLLRRNGDTERSEIAKQQYMEEQFLPAVELIVNLTSPDELLNNAAALKELDKYAITTGRSDGYTASYVRQAYGDQLGKRTVGSDPEVTNAVMRIRKAADDMDIRSAVGLARSIKKAIDNGENLASDEDYALIGRVVAYAG